jgi:glycosyltransferase involved in cell wall biosynthesis
LNHHTKNGSADAWPTQGQESTFVTAPANRPRRLLFLLPHVPGPEAPTGGARSTFQLIAGLSQGHQIAVLCLRSSFDLPTDDALKRACDVVEEIPRDTRARHNRNSLRRAQGTISAVFNKPSWVLSTDIPAYRERLRSLAKSWEPDIVHIGYHVMAQYARELQACPAPRVLTQYEPAVTAARDAVRTLRGLSRVRGRLEVAAWSRYERHAMSQVDAIVVFTERDRQALAALAGGAPLVRIPLGVAIPAAPLDPCGAPAPTVLFVGNFIHRPNVDAALWLMRSIFPLVSRERPDARLILVGPNPPNQVRALAGQTMTVTGGVASVFPFLNDATVVVAPLRTGGGMRVKVLEALAAGKALVASPLAVAGLDVCDGEQLVLAERDHEFASAIVSLLDNAAARRRLAQSARTWAVRNLSWSRSVAAYETLHEQLLAQRQSDVR